MGTRAIARIIGLAVVMSLVTPTPALAREPGTYWRAETEGLPTATQIGQWDESDHGRTVRLEFLGGHLVGGGTRFVGGWLTPFTTCGKAACWVGEGGMENVNELGDDIDLVMRFRYRYKGKRWSEWITIPFTLEQGTTWLGWGGEGFFSRRRPVQFEWRLRGHIKAPTYLGGWAELSID